MNQYFKIKKQLQLALVFISLLILTTATYLICIKYTETIEKAQSEAHNVVNAAYLHSEQVMDSIDQAIGNFQFDQKSIPSHSDEILHNNLKSRIYNLAHTNSFVIIDQNGKIQASSNVFPTLRRDYSHSINFQYHLKHNHYELFVGSLINNEIPVSRRLNDTNGKFAGVFLALLDPAYFYQFFKSFEIPEMSSISLYSKIPENQLLLRYQRGEASEDTSYIIAERQVRSRPLWIQVQFSRDAVLKSWKNESIVITTFALGAAILFFILFRIIIQQLQNTAKKSEDSKRMETTIQSILKHTSKTIGQDYFEALCVQLSKVLESKYAFIGELLPEKTKVKTIAFSVDQQIMPNVTYDLAHTPCEGVLGQEICFYENGIQQLFPEDFMLEDMNAESYIGLTLFDSHKNPVGIMVVIDEKPMKESHLARSLMGVFAARASAELERLRTEDTKKQLQQQMMQNQKLEAMGVLASGIAHDFNNILTSIFGNLEIAMHKIDRNDSSYSSLEKVRKASFRAKDLVQQILTFSRKQEFNKKPVSLNKVCDEVFQLIRAAIPTTIQLEYEAPKNEDFIILGDATQVHQVLMNLCTNASQAVDTDSGKIKITLQKIVRYKENFAQITISDNGVGIPKESLDKIFEPFYTTKKIGEGTGLGLAVAQTIMENHEGTIRVESTLNQGTQFHIQFPVAGIQKLASIPQDIAPQKGNNENILVVDDDEELLVTLTKFLEIHGYNAKAYNRAETALNHFKDNAQNYSLVITDMTMPGMRGDVFIQEIKKVQPNKPIILSTGLSASITDSSFYHDYEILRKPYDFNSLLEIIQKNIQTH